MFGKHGALADDSGRPASPLTVLGASRAGLAPGQKLQQQQQINILRVGVDPVHAAAQGPSSSSSPAATAAKHSPGRSVSPGPNPGHGSSSSVTRSLQDSKHSRELLTGVSPLPGTVQRWVLSWSASATHMQMC
jgi:hypothetical protein